MCLVDIYILCCICGDRGWGVGVGVAGRGWFSVCSTLDGC